jgi:hypothetical protein
MSVELAFATMARTDMKILQLSERLVALATRSARSFISANSPRPAA